MQGSRGSVSVCTAADATSFLQMDQPRRDGTMVNENRQSAGRRQQKRTDNIEREEGREGEKHARERERDGERNRREI